jgi:extradiol dioxygenase family protein
MDAAREFYGDILGLIEGRRSGNKWQDYSLFGHQLVCHYVGDDYRGNDYYNPVDGDEVPVAHFGAVVSKEEFDTLASSLQKNNVKFIIPPTLRFQGAPGEQWTMFFKDPSNNNLEFKHVTNPQLLFARYDVVE